MEQVIIVRHGATEWSESGRHTSRTDLPLLPSGVRAAKAVRPLLADVLGAGRRPGLVLVSPRRRAQQTADGAGLLLGDVPAETDPDLAEVDYGEYEGLTTAQIRERVPGWSVWTHPMPGGESMAAAGERADRVLARAREAATGPVVLVGHGHFSRVLGARWLDLPASDGRLLALGTGGVSVLGLEHEQPVLLRWNLPNPALPRT